MKTAITIGKGIICLYIFDMKPLLLIGKVFLPLFFFPVSDSSFINIHLGKHLQMVRICYENFEAYSLGAYSSQQLVGKQKIYLYFIYILVSFFLKYTRRRQ